MLIRSTEEAQRKQSHFSPQNKSFLRFADSRRGVFDDPMELLRRARILFRSTKHVLLAREQFIKHVWHCTRNGFGARKLPAESTPRPNVLYLSSGTPQGAQTIVSCSCRARFPADQSCLDATSLVAASRDESLLLFEALARLGGRLRLPGALRRRPRFARLGLASLGLAELRKWLSSAGTP